MTLRDRLGRNKKLAHYRSAIFRAKARQRAPIRSEQDTNSINLARLRADRAEQRRCIVGAVRCVCRPAVAPIYSAPVRSCKVLREKIVCGSLNISERHRAAPIQDIDVREMRDTQTPGSARFARRRHARAPSVDPYQIMARKRRQTGLRRRRNMR
jgi:hypothetical protein